MTVGDEDRTKVPEESENELWLPPATKPGLSCGPRVVMPPIHVEPFGDLKRYDSNAPPVPAGLDRKPWVP